MSNCGGGTFFLYLGFAALAHHSLYPHIVQFARCLNTEGQVAAKAKADLMHAECDRARALDADKDKMISDHPA